MNSTRQETSSHTARNEAVAAIWARRTERVITVSTGTVHFARHGRPVCGTRQASRIAADGITPTCELCGAVPA